MLISFFENIYGNFLDVVVLLACSFDPLVFAFEVGPSVDYISQKIAVKAHYSI